MGTASATVDSAAAPLKKPKTRRVAVGFAVGAFVLAAALFGAWAFLRYRGAESLASSRATLLTRAKSLASEKWERPVVHGEAVDGDAAAAQRAAIAALLPLPTEPLVRFRERAEAGDTFADLQALVAEKRAGLDALRAATKLGWTRLAPALTDPSAMDGRGDPGSSGAAAISAWKLLLAGAAASDPETCLDTALDVIRLGQDRHASEGMVGAMVGAVAIDLAAPIAVRCAVRASGLESYNASVWMHQLAWSAPPFGPVMELEDVQMGLRMLALHDRAPAFPTSREELDTFFERYELVRALAILLERQPWRTELAYPAELERVREMSDARFRSANVFVSLTASPARFAERYAAANAKLRALVIAIQGVKVGPASELVEHLREYEDLVDPLTGKPFRIEEDATTWRVVSPGLDGVRGGDSSDDVVVTVPRVAP